jgi:hypothetical protein
LALAVHSDAFDALPGPLDMNVALAMQSVDSASMLGWALLPFAFMHVLNRGSDRVSYFPRMEAEVRARAAMLSEDVETFIWNGREVEEACESDGCLLLGSESTGMTCLEVEKDGELQWVCV